MEETVDVAIIGSGPAGLTAGIYTTRGVASTVIFAGEKWGGQLMLTTLIENFPGFANGIQGPDLMLAMKTQAENLGAKTIPENVIEANFTNRPYNIRSTKYNIHAWSVIIATGALTQWLGVPGESKLIGRGVSSCAPCDAPFFKEKQVAVIGGGDSAMEEALVLTKYAKLVTIIHRRDSFKASQIMQQKVLSNSKIKIIWNTEVQEVIGTEKLEKLILKNTVDGKTVEFPIDGCFVAIGHKPDSDIFKGQNLPASGVVDLDEQGYIKKMPSNDYSMATSVPGVFVAGDVHDAHYKQAITAAGFGCQAALDALKYLSNN